MPKSDPSPVMPPETDTNSFATFIPTLKSACGEDNQKISFPSSPSPEIPPSCLYHWVPDLTREYSRETEMAHLPPAHTSLSARRHELASIARVR
ncbi:hypothetical protein PoB_004855600 [Plakobranchus ocellatus]|uniref:Uncharacterized protein n=1 Tax=Plakobranchus ocellatus TaxID=259542 RepID=A0AAV4BSK0_9GAST|nr:hypothetical protein PoB_004855600 [Plakobranchus ocellatus]